MPPFIDGFSICNSDTYLLFLPNLQKSLPLLRQSMVNNELTIEGIKAPPASVVYQTAIATATTTAMTLVAAATTQTSQVSGSAGTGSVVATATASTVPPPSATPIVPPISHLSSIVPTSTSMVSLTQFVEVLKCRFLINV